MGDEINIQDKKFALREVFEALEYSMTVLDNATCFNENDCDYILMKHIYSDILNLYETIGYLEGKR